MGHLYDIVKCHFQHYAHCLLCLLYFLSVLQYLSFKNPFMCIGVIVLFDLGSNLLSYAFLSGNFV